MNTKDTVPERIWLDESGGFLTSRPFNSRSNEYVRVGLAGPGQPARDIVTTARTFNTVENCGINPQKASELIEALAAEAEALRRGEYICQRCHHRKDAEAEPANF